MQAGYALNTSRRYHSHHEWVTRKRQPCKAKGKSHWGQVSSNGMLLAFGRGVVFLVWVCPEHRRTFSVPWPSPVPNICRVLWVVIGVAENVSTLFPRGRATTPLVENHWYSREQRPGPWVRNAPGLCNEQQAGQSAWHITSDGERGESWLYSHVCLAVAYWVCLLSAGKISYRRQEDEQSTEATVTHTLSVQYQERGYDSMGNLMTFCCPGAAVSKAGRRGKWANYNISSILKCIFLFTFQPSWNQNVCHNHHHILSLSESVCQNQQQPGRKS